jgi:hypothetical protein
MVIFVSFFNCYQAPHFEAAGEKAKLGYFNQTIIKSTVSLEVRVSSCESTYAEFVTFHLRIQNLDNCLNILILLIWAQSYKTFRRQMNQFIGVRCLNKRLNKRLKVLWNWALNWFIPKLMISFSTNKGSFK